MATEKANSRAWQFTLVINGWHFIYLECRLGFRVWVWYLRRPFKINYRKLTMFNFKTGAVTK